MSNSSATAPRSGEQVLSVAQLTAQLKGVVGQNFSSVWVVGEISNFARPQSGHCYFTLKDDTAQLRAVVWRGTASRLKFDLHDGLEVVCRGRLDVYPPRGSYQLVVDQLQPKGIGALELALRKLRDQLTKEGLFDTSRKQPLPLFPRRIGIVTSPTGAAIHDFLQVARRRWQGTNVLIFPVRVQGDGAAEEIAKGIRKANQLRPPLDVLVVGRGGGSLEDLWSFNEEAVVRAIAASHVPTVSAVGHEIDVTLADLAADVRALTPSEAAERVVPSARDVADSIGNLRHRLQHALASRASASRERLTALASRPVLARPLDSVNERSRQVDELTTRVRRAIDESLRNCHHNVNAISGKLKTLSPLGVLERGYSLTTGEKTGQLVTDSKQVRKGQKICTRLTQGTIISIVEKVDRQTSTKT